MPCSLNAGEWVDDDFSWGSGSERAGIRAGDPIAGIRALPGKKEQWICKDFHFGGEPGAEGGFAVYRADPEKQGASGDSLKVMVRPDAGTVAKVRLKTEFQPIEGKGVNAVAIGWQAVNATHTYLINQLENYVAVILSQNGRVVIRMATDAVVQEPIQIDRLDFEEGEWIEIELRTDPEGRKVACHLETDRGAMAEGSAPWNGSPGDIPIFAVNFMGCDRQAQDASVIDWVRVTERQP